MQTANSIYQQAMQPWPALADAGKRIKLTGSDLELYYFEAGEHNHKHLLMVHGLGDEADTWRHIFLPLSTDYHVLALDLPGFGRSDQPDLKYTPIFMIEALTGLLDQLNIPNVTVFGSSLGGILAHAMALTHPKRVTGLVLVGGAMLQSEPTQDWALRLMRLPLIGEWLYTRLRKDPNAAFASLRSVYHQLDSMPEADRDFLFTRVNQRVWSDEQRRAYFSTLRQLAPWLKRNQSDWKVKLPQLRTPTLVVRGEYDSLYSEANADALVEMQPNATKAIIPNAGHLPHQEQPEDFLQTIKPWLGDH
ncbi:MAG: alpha/beta fold hydrolase [Brevefilum sp.]